MKKFVILALLCPMIALCACSIGNNGNSDGNISDKGTDPFDFVSNSVNPEIVVDGYNDEDLWKSDNLVKVSGVGGAEISIVRKSNAIYLFYKVKDITQYRYVGDGAAEEVTRSDSVEVYFDAKLTRTSMPSAYDFQINLGRDSRTRICTGQGWRYWMALYMFEVREGMYEDEEYYFVEAMIPTAQMGIADGGAIGIAFGQVDRFIDVNNDLAGYFSWNGLHYNGKLVDPQIPSTYLVLTANGSRLYTYEEYVKLGQ